MLFRSAPLLVTGVPVNLPENHAKALDQDQKPAIVSIDRDGRVFIDEVEISMSDLPGRLDEIRASTAGMDPKQIYLRADKALDYGRVMFVMGELNRAGLYKVALVSTAASDRSGDSAGSAKGQ